MSYEIALHLGALEEKPPAPVLHGIAAAHQRDY